MDCLKSILTYKEQFIGIHFFSPVVLNSLVEVAVTDDTSSAVKEKVVETLKYLKKDVYIVPNIQGYVYNRILFAQLMEAMNLADTYHLQPEEIDHIVKQGGNTNYGPFELMDLIGLDVIGQCLSNMYRDKKDFCLPRILETKIEKGNYGKKTGVGFYIK